MTAICPTPILPPATSSIRSAWRQQLAQPEERLPEMRLGASGEEKVVGDEYEERLAARRAAFKRLFEDLPPSDTPGYWQRIEQAPKEAALPLEVLVCCLRERWSAGAHRHTGRIFASILRRIQSRTNAWAWTIASQCHSGQHQMQQDLQQGCYTALWEELIDDGPTFLLEKFLHALDRIQRHVAHAEMEKAGEWKRRGVKTPTRIPPKDISSIFEEIDTEEELRLEEILADPGAWEAFKHAELSGDIRPLLNRLPPRLRAVIHDRFWRGLTLEEIARAYEVTDRTVQNWLKEALTLLLRWFLGGEEDHHG